MIKEGKRTVIITYKCGHVREETVLDFANSADIYSKALKETVCPACQFANKHHSLGKAINV